MSVVTAIRLKRAYYRATGRGDDAAHAPLRLFLAKSVAVGVIDYLDSIAVERAATIAGGYKNVALTPLTAYKAKVASRCGVDADTLYLIASMLVRGALTPAAVEGVLDAQGIDADVSLGNYAQKLFLCAVAGAALVSIAL